MAKTNILKQGSEKSADIDPISRFDDKLTELEKALYLLKSTLDAYRLISLNAPAIKRGNGGAIFFAHVQHLSLEFYVLGICKVFEQERKRGRHELHSLCAVLDDAATHALRNEGPLRDFLARYSTVHKSKATAGASTLDEVRRIYRGFIRQHAKEYKRLQHVRDRVIAHCEHLETAKKPRSLPSYDFMERLLFFAVDLHSAISRAYLGVHPHPIKEEGRVAGSICSTLGKLGIKGVKTRFDDE